MRKTSRMVWLNELNRIAIDIANDASKKEKEGYKFEKDKAWLKPPYEEGDAYDYIEWVVSELSANQFAKTFIYEKACDLYSKYKLAEQEIDKFMKKNGENK